VPGDAARGSEAVAGAVVVISNAEGARLEGGAELERDKPSLFDVEPKAVIGRIEPRAAYGAR